MKRRGLHTLFILIVLIIACTCVCHATTLPNGDEVLVGVSCTRDDQRVFIPSPLLSVRYSDSDNTIYAVLKSEADYISEGHTKDEYYKEWVKIVPTAKGINGVYTEQISYDIIVNTKDTLLNNGYNLVYYGMYLTDDKLQDFFNNPGAYYYCAGNVPCGGAVSNLNVYPDGSGAAEFWYNGYGNGYYFAYMYDIDGNGTYSEPCYFKTNIDVRMGVDFKATLNVPQGYFPCSDNYVNESNEGTIQKEVLDTSSNWLIGSNSFKIMPKDRIVMGDYDYKMSLDEYNKHGIIYDYDESIGYMHIYIDEDKLNSAEPMSLYPVPPAGAKYYVRFSYADNSYSKAPYVKYTEANLIDGLDSYLSQSAIFDVNEISQHNELYVYGVNQYDGVTVFFIRPETSGVCGFRFYDANMNIIEQDVFYYAVENQFNSFTISAIDDISKLSDKYKNSYGEVNVPIMIWDGDASLVVEMPPQEANSNTTFFELYGKGSDYSNNKKRHVFIPYSYFGFDSNPHDKDITYKIKHYFSKEMTDYEILTGTPTGNGVRFELYSFSPMIAYTEVETHKYNVVDKKDATCVEKGYIRYKCSDCEASYEEVIPINPFAHVIKDGICEICGLTESVALEQQKGLNIADYVIQENDIAKEAVDINKVEDEEKIVVFDIEKYSRIVWLICGICLILLLIIGTCFVGKNPFERKAHK